MKEIKKEILIELRDHFYKKANELKNNDSKMFTGFVYICMANELDDKINNLTYS